METCLGYLENVAKPIGEEGTIIVVDDFDALIVRVDKTPELCALGEELTIEVHSDDVGTVV